MQMSVTSVGGGAICWMFTDSGGSRGMRLG